MSEELENKDVVAASPATPAVEAKPAENTPAAPTEPPAPATEPATPTAAPVPPAVPPKADPKETEPQVVIQTERGFAHYVGFALLCVLCIAFYFTPGITIAYAINMIPGVNLTGVAAWVLGAIFSVIIWIILKLKIKGFKKSFYIYIALCVVVFAALVAIQIAFENVHIFANILAMLSGAST